MNIHYRCDLIHLLRVYSLPKVAAEIGVAEGLFSRDMMDWGLDRLYCVDAWEHIPDVKGDGNQPKSWHDANYLNAQKLLSIWPSKVKLLKGRSVDMAQKVADNTLGLLYLDANHSEEGVTSDLQAWYSKVVQGGIIAGHDYLNPCYGVNQAVKAFCQDRLPINIIYENKAEDAGFWFQKI